VIIVTLGVADRFLLLRQERDQAIVRANTLKQLSERDALTGLHNRRVIEERFAMLRNEGFTTLAVVDLDHFKRVNDTFGHAKGDLVLKTVGKALQANDPNAMAFRMGGEEFLLLLRGSDAVQHAERQRQEIARAVAMEDLGCLVTASMGIVEITGGALPGASFATIYARADRLLYEAKATGRNRMVCERIKAFQPRRRDRRAA
jgi:diguanylate cyclase (GGDEF)-like protein